MQILLAFSHPDGNYKNDLKSSPVVSLSLLHKRTTTAKNMGIFKYHPTSLISYERGWALACLEDIIKPNQASHQGAR
jgi:hypothetical protein